MPFQSLVYVTFSFVGMLACIYNMILTQKLAMPFQSLVCVTFSFVGMLLALAGQYTFGLKIGNAISNLVSITFFFCGNFGGSSRKCVRLQSSHSH